MAKGGSNPGERRGGRKKGTPNLATVTLSEKLQALGCDAIQGLARIAMGSQSCTVCLGRKKLKYARNPEGKLVFDPEKGKLLDCLHCYGGGFEPIPIAVCMKAYAELAQYEHPKRKAIEVTEKRKNGCTFEELLATMKEVMDEEKRSAT